MRFTLRPKSGGQTFQKITTGRRWVGRVAQCADGTYIATLGRAITVRNMPTAEAAFRQAVAQHFGFANAEALHAQNRAVARRNRANRAAARHELDSILRGLFSRRPARNDGTLQSEPEGEDL